MSLGAKLPVVAVAILGALLSLVAATQFIAGVFDGQAALGAPLLVLGEARIYPPWALIEWSSAWAHVYARPFATAHAILAAGITISLLFAAIAQRGRLPLPAFGRKSWGSFEDARLAGLLSAGGTVLGKLDGEILCFDGPEHQLLVGASRSGKGRGHVVPTLLAWPRSALVLDVKGELADGDERHGFPGTAGFRESLGPVLRFAPTRADSCCFNPLFEVRLGPNEVRDVQNIVEIIIDPAGDSRHQDFWDRSAKQVLVGVILHVLYSEPLARKTLAVVREKLRDLQRTSEEMRTTLHRRNPETNAAEVHPEVLHAAESFLAAEERMQSGVKATAESFFGLFADPIVAEKTGASDFRIADLMCGERPVTLYLQPPPSDAMRLMPLMRLLLNQIARALMESQTHALGRRKRHNLLLVLDEFPQFGRMPFFETAMGAMAGYGLKAYLVCQSLNHIVRAYGRDNVILDNCHVVTAFAAADMDTAKRIADMAGETWEERPQESVQKPRALLGPRKGSITYREERRPLLLPGDVRQLGRDEQLIFVSGTKPLRTQKLRFDREPIFAKRLRLAQRAPTTLTTAHEWERVAPLGRLAKDKKGATRVEPAPRRQGDLFDGALSISERALAGLRQADSTSSPRHPRGTGV